ncbi:MAG: hypothetical protein HY287_16455 [Planctomycetes bacterium]|nr:hypothetical protein [Planctomycetota bacterium]MBI3835918.1 hypothetical protein [Planctomycetota bacterium]
MEVDAIHKRARADLLISTTHGDVDVFLWEHSLRVATNCIRITRFEELAGRKIEFLALFVAALYHDSAWAKRCREGVIERLEVLVGTPQENDSEVAVSIMRHGMGILLPETTIDCAAAAILSRNDRALATIEGQILSEADNLEEFGLASLWSIVRRGALEGKGIRTAIEIWRRKKEYQFWTARLTDSFRFESVREMARSRLIKLEDFLEELANEALIDESSFVLDPFRAAATSED